MDLLDRMLQHDAWTTARLLDCARGLCDDQLDQRFEFGHASVRATFIHIIQNLCTWTDLMSGSVHPSPWIAPDAPIASLIEYQREASDRLYRLGREIADQGRLNETFVDTLDSPPRRKSFGGGLLHLATHGMHHRAQLLIMLRQLGVQDLPEGDALGWERQCVGGWEPA